MLLRLTNPTKWCASSSINSLCMTVVRKTLLGRAAVVSFCVATYVPFPVYDRHAGLFFNAPKLIDGPSRWVGLTVSQLDWGFVDILSYSLLPLPLAVQYAFWHDTLALQ